MINQELYPSGVEHVDARSRPSVSRMEVKDEINNGEESDKRYLKKTICYVW